MKLGRVLLSLSPALLGLAGAALFQIDLTPELLTVIAATTLSLVFDYFPTVSEWYDSLTEAGKRQVMLGLLVTALAVIFAGNCFSVVDVSAVTCDAQGVVSALQILFLAVTGNYAFHKVTKPTEGYKMRMFSKG